MKNAEETRIKNLTQKMKAQQDEALRQQWAYAESLRLKSIEELREKLREEIYNVSEIDKQNEINEALHKAAVSIIIIIIQSH